jgi:hypothetical protein
MRMNLKLDLNYKKKKEEERENKMLKITIFNRDKDHEKDHYYDIVSTFFIMMIQKYLKSKLSFSMII